MRQAKPRDRKIYITDAAIEKVSKIEISGFSDEQNEILLKKHKELLKIAKEKNDSNEVLIIWDTSSLKEITILGSENMVVTDSPEVFSFVRNSELHSLGYLHNHPSTRNFSGKDIETFVFGSKIRFVTVVTNQGEVRSLNKTEKYVFKNVKNIYNALVKKVLNGEILGENFVLSFIKAAAKEGIEYVRSK